jgi:hypothetical protein
MADPVRSKVFISYAKKNVKWLERIQTHLSPLVRTQDIDLWDDTKIKAGTNWRVEAEKALSEARVAVLVISAEYLASDAIVNNELPPLLAAAATQELVILSLIVSPSRIDLTPLITYAPVNPFEKPLSGMTKHKQDEFLVKLTRDIEEALKA